MMFSGAVFVWEMKDGRKLEAGFVRYETKIAVSQVFTFLNFGDQ